MFSSLFGSTPEEDGKKKEKSCMSVEGGQIQPILEEMSQKEKEALNKFSELAEEKKYKAEPNHPMDTVTFVRFLIANKFNIKNATSQLEATLKFREEANPFKITPKDCQISIKQGTWRYCGFSKTGASVIKITVEKWRPGEYTVDEHQNLFLFYLEQALHQTKDNYQFICLFDMHGWSLQVCMLCRRLLKNKSILDNRAKYNTQSSSFSLKACSLTMESAH